MVINTYMSYNIPQETMLSRWAVLAVMVVLAMTVDASRLTRQGELCVCVCDVQSFQTE